MKTAIILGASGLTGGLVLEKLLMDNNYSSIKVFVRNSLHKTHPKLEEIICGLLQLEEQENLFQADEVYCCIGTTMKKTPDKKVYRAIDFGIPVNAAKLCSKNRISTLITVSALGANAKSSIFYNRTKGEMEAAVLDEKIKNTYFLQPSFIGGNRSEKRTGEKIGIAIFKFINPILIGPLRKYRLIEAKKIALAMVFLAENGFKRVVIESDEIQNLVH
jgi:uncharacterized protein YbjT (DUF2867 family)